MTPPDYETGFDDDGENWAGSRLQKVLFAAPEEGLLVVARWWGGTMLGPIRFDHIIQASADAIVTYRLAHSTQRSESNRAKGKESYDAEKETRLRMLLKVRDLTIESLRKVVNERRNVSGSKDVQSQEESPSKKRMPLNYETMPLVTLERLMKARDLTIKSLRSVLKEL